MWEEGDGLFDLFNNGLDGDSDDDVPQCLPTAKFNAAITDARPITNFVGLLNLCVYPFPSRFSFPSGATCYLNSLLQALYMTPEFRQGIYELIPDEVSQDVTPTQVVTPVVDQEEKVKSKLFLVAESLGKFIRNGISRAFGCGCPTQVSGCKSSSPTH